MWNCQGCGQSIEDEFDACWNCGTSVDGTSDPGFVPQREFVPKDEPVGPVKGEEVVHQIDRWNGKTLGKFYGHFAAAYGTLWLVMLAMAMVTSSHINTGAFGLCGFPVIAFAYAIVRCSNNIGSS